MDILDWLILQPFKQDYLMSAIILFGEAEVYSYINLGFILTDGFGITINLQ